MFDAIDPKSAVPIYRQIMDQIRHGVAVGRLARGDRLPSVRDLAARLLVNPNTVARVYRNLEKDGLLETRRGQGTYISAGARALAPPGRRRLLADQLERAAKDAQALGVSSGEAVHLFRKILADQAEGGGQR
jgi:GntR family transcriptional regulator